MAMDTTTEKLYEVPTPEAEVRIHSGDWELEHAYGGRVHLLDNLFLHSSLARLSSPRTRLPEIIGLLRSVYETLLSYATQEFPSVRTELPTRMSTSHPSEGIYRGPVFDTTTNVVICDVIRAGVVPSQVCFERLLSVLPEERVRLDHLNMSRLTDDRGQITGVDLAGSKIGGSVDDSILIIPDPMGATGSTVLRAVRHYLEEHGKPAKIIAMPMIATPEFLRNVLAEIEDLVVYTARLDRGLSPPDVLETIPGTHWDREKGLNDLSYIVPGAGGMGEILNNAWC